MPMKCEIDGEVGVIMLRGWGTLTDQEMLDAVKELRTSPDLRPNMPTLSDMTNVERLNITPNGLAKTIEHMESTSDRRGISRAAIVVRPGDEAAGILANMFATMSNANRVQPSFKVFHNFADAERWLSLGVGA